MRNYFSVILLFSLMRCYGGEHYVAAQDVPGLYVRKSSGLEEFICIHTEDSLYSYTMKTEDGSKVVSKRRWGFYVINGKSIVMFESIRLNDRGTEINFGMPVKYSEAKEAILIRVDPDDHFKDFVKFESACK